MIRLRVWMLGLFLPLLLPAAEQVFDFTGTPAGELPAGWTNQLAGSGKPGDWKVVMEDVPPTFEPLSSQAPKFTRRAVLAQSSATAEDERFPIAVYTGDRFGDFTFTARFQITGGALEQIAGLVFRHQDAKNFYVLRASALGGNLRFYKFVDGQRSPPIGPLIPFTKGRWYELAVRTSGNQIDVLLDGTNVFPTITDNTFVSGRVGFITKSDTTALFSDARITYKPLETLATSLVRQTLADQPRMLNLRLYGTSAARSELHCLAAKDPKDVGIAATKTEIKVFEENQTYFGKNPDAAIVTAPLHDRNGEVIGVMKFFLKPYAGQVESTTVARVLPTLKKLESSIGGARELTE
jgi:hypothetical protein